MRSTTGTAPADRTRRAGCVHLYGALAHIYGESCCRLCGKTQLRCVGTAGKFIWYAVTATVAREGHPTYGHADPRKIHTRACTHTHVGR